MVPQSLADSPHRPQKFDKNSWLFLDARVLNVKANLGEIFLNLLRKPEFAKVHSLRKKYFA